MAYYKKVLQPGETVKFVGSLHWMVYRTSILLFLLAIVAYFGFAFLPDVQQNVMLIVVGALVALAILSFLRIWFISMTTEIVVTDKRIIHKVGWIGRQTQEMNVSKVETVDVDQGIGGRIFGFGSVLIKGIGGSWEPLKFIASPLQLRSAIMVG